MEQCEAKWLKEFNLDLCEIVTVANKMPYVNYPNNTHAKELAHVQHAKYLGRTCSNIFRWNTHIDNIGKKTNVTCAFLSRSMNSCLRQVNAQCFTTLVLPKIEYAATVWDHYIQFNINTPEKCQCRAARFVSGDYSSESSATSMLKKLKYPPLQQRRTNTKMVMMYRIIHHLIAIPSQMHLTSATTRITRDHDQKCSIPFSRISSHKYLYYPTAIRTWNSLPSVLISVPTLGAFKYMCRHSYHKFYCKYYMFDMCFLSHASVSANVHSTSSIILRTTEG